MNRIELVGVSLGLYATLAQVVLMREALTVSGGNELVIGLSFAAWLMGVGVGAVVAGRLPRPGRTFVVSSLVSPLLCSGGLLFIRLHRMVVDVPPGGDPSLVQMAVLLGAGLGIGGVTVGFVFTAAARAAAQSSGRPVSRLYTAEAVGSLVGGLVFTFVLSHTAPHLLVLGFCGSLLPLTLLFTEKSKITPFVSGAIAFVLLAACAFGPLSAFDRYTSVLAFDLLGVGGRLEASKDTAYSRLILSRNEDQFQVFADNRLDHSFPDPWGKAPLVHLALSQHPAPGRVLIVGGGPSDVLEAALAHNPRRVVLTQLDDQLHALCRPFWPKSTLSALADSRVVTVHDDGRNFIMRTEERFDVVIVNARPPLSAQANRYHTREFFQGVSRVLGPGGSLTVLAPGGANVLAPEAARAAAAEMATVRSVFAHVVIVPGLRISIHASNDEHVVSDSARVLTERYVGRHVDAAAFSFRRFESMLDPQRTADALRQINSWPPLVNTDTRPLAYLANLQLWERSLSGRQSAEMPTWTGLAERWAWIWLAAPLLAWLVWMGPRLIRRTGGPHAAVFSMGTTGAAGMALTVIVLYMYQAASGRLYKGLALLIALFMAGLAAGAYLSRYISRQGMVSAGIITDISILLVVLVSGLVLGSGVETPGIIVAWSFLAGLVTGAAFPALLGITAESCRGDERRAAAMVEASDHFGAAYGALVTGLIWLPTLGILWTSVFFALLKLASLVGQVASQPEKRGRKNPTLR